MKFHSSTCIAFTLAALIAFPLLMTACADRPSPDTSGARPNEPPYPVLMVDEADRRAAALADWAKLTSEHGVPTPQLPTLHAATATILSLPSSITLDLPKLGSGTLSTEEEIRESLRRFIASAGHLLGAEPQQLSLIQRTDLADGSRKAHYEQRPFRFPLRGDYGSLDITFTSDRRVLQITSTCIPDIELLQRAAVGTRPRWPADKVTERVLGKTYSYTDINGSGQTLTLEKAQSIIVRELVIYPIPRKNNPSVLEFHLCWEIATGPNPAADLIYIDAITEELIAVRPTSK